MDVNRFILIDSLMQLYKYFMLGTVTCLDYETKTDTELTLMPCLVPLCHCHNHHRFSDHYL